MAFPSNGLPNLRVGAIERNPGVASVLDEQLRECVGQEVRGDVAIADCSSEEAVDLGCVSLVRIAGLCSSHADAER